jgi:hypothetical protein
MLHTLAHFDQVLQDVSCGGFQRFDIDAGDGNEEIKTRENVPTALHFLVQLYHGLALFLETSEVIFQVTELVQDFHVKLVVALRGEEAGAELAEHVGGVGQGAFQVIVVLRELRR